MGSAIKDAAGIILHQRRRIDPSDVPPAVPGAGETIPSVEAAPASTQGTATSGAAAIVTATTSVGKKPRKRKVGRPKAGRLDVPKATHAPLPEPVLTATATDAKTDAPAEIKAETTVKAPVISHLATPAPENSADAGTGPKHLADIRPRQPKAKPQPPAHHVHHVGVAPLHFGSVMGFAVKARVRHHHLLLMSLAGAITGVVGGLGAWFALNGQLPKLATGVLDATPKLLGELAIIAVLYYIGRSLGQAAITYGVIREADSRPVGLATQLGIAVNTFGRRLALDALYGIVQLILLTAIVVLVLTGGTNWGIEPIYQVIALFACYLVLLYFLGAAAISHGLAVVAIVLTKLRAGHALALGWHLFSHRLELIGIRVIAMLLETLLAVPMVAAAIALFVYAPTAWHIPAAIAIGVIAWLAGALAGAGTATWWAAIYRKIILLDHASGAVELLSSRQPSEASRLRLAVIVGVSGMLLAAGVFWPMV